MQTVSTLYRSALLVSHEKHQNITVTTPDGQTHTLRWSAGSVSSSGDSGVRYTATVSLVPEPGVDVYGLVSTPGALFTLTDGIDFGAGLVETVPLGVYEASDGGADIIEGDVSLSLVDQWQRIERCRFTTPYKPDTGIWTTRAEFIAAAVDEAIPGVTVDIRDDGGNYTLTDRSWDRDRTEFINDFATDGGLDVYFDADGSFVIRKQPIMDPTASVWTFRTGDAAGTILTAEREKPFDRMYNMVVVNPIDDTQTWDTESVELQDETHPLHKSKIGPSPFFYSSPTLTTGAAAFDAAETILQRILGRPETLSIGALAAPLEVGDVVTVVHPATDYDPGFNAVHILDSFDYDLESGLMTAKTRSSDLAELTES